MHMNILQQVTKEISYMFLLNYVFYVAKSNWRYVSFNTVLNMYFARNKTFEVK